MPTRADAEALDAADELAHWREKFALPDGVYLDGMLPHVSPLVCIRTNVSLSGFPSLPKVKLNTLYAGNSLGVMPKATPAVVQEASLPKASDAKAAPRMQDCS